MTVENIQENQWLFETAFECSPNGILVVDENLIVRYANKMLRNDNPKIVLDQSFCYQAIAGRSEPCEDCPCLKTFQTGEPQKFIFHNLRADRWSELTSYPIFNPVTGKLTFVFEFIRNIDEQRRHEENLNHREKLLNAILDSSQEAILALTDGMGEPFANAKYSDFFSRWKELRFNDPLELVRSLYDETLLDVDVLMEMIADVRKNHHLRDGIVHKRNGRIFYLRGQTAQTDLGKTGITEIWTHRDITEQVRFEQTLRIMQTTIDKLSIPMFRVSKSGQIVYVNNSMIQSLGYENGDQILNRPIWEICITYTEQDWSEFWTKLLATQSIKINEQVYCYDGTKYPAELFCDLIEQDGKNYMVASIHDLTEQMLRIEAEKASGEKSKFLAHMSHEIRTPLNGVIGMCDLLLGTELTPKQREYTITAQSSGKHLLSLINDILDFSKIEAGKLEIESYEFNLPELIDSVFGIFALTALSKRLELCEVFRTKIPQNVVGDASRIRQILVNFIGNAIKFTSEGGVRLMIEVVEVNDWRVPVRQRLRFDVIDSGIGIPKSRKDSLFTSFSQIDSSFARRFGGTGLGLAISKDLIYQMGGIVGVESVEGEGSDFWFEIPFPVTETPLKEPSINVPFDHLLFSGVPVFVIAGNLVLLDALTSQLQSWNMDVSAFSTIRAAKESFNPDFPPRFVLADHAVFDLEKVVADGIFPRTIGAVPQQSQTTIILFVPIGESLNTANPIHSHVDLFLTKPVLSAVLAEVLTAVLDGTETKQLLRNWQQKQLVQTKQLQHNEIERIDGVFEQFTAPSTRILVVDDNFTNLLVWEGLLEPYGCEVLSVSSGREAINILGKEYFDLVLMDQMMPDLDGLQTMKLIRKLSGRKLRCFPKKNNRVDNSSDTFVQVDESYFKKIPIIVATANALVNMREEYLHNGFNDYIAKPIHLAHLNTILKQWIPSEKQLSLETSNRTFAVSEESSSVSIEMLSKLQLPHVNVLEGLQFVNGNMNNYFHVLESFRFHAPENFRSAHTFCQEERWQDLIIEVHSVKSLAKIIGANQLAALAAELEAAGKQEDYETIRKNINQYLQIFQSVLTDVDIMLQLIVPPKEPKSDTTPAELTDEELHSLMNEARIVLEGYDTDQAAQLLKRISLESLPPELIKKIEEIQMSITQFDYKHAVQLLKELCQCD